MGALFRLNLLGGFSMVERSTGLPIDLRQRRTRCMLGLLAVSPGARLSRDRLTGLFWERSSEDQAKTSLRQCCLQIRKATEHISPTVLYSDRNFVGLNLEEIKVDVLELERDINRPGADLAAAAISSLWHGEFLEGQEPSAPLFEAWLHLERARLRQALTDYLSRILAKQQAAGDFASPDVARELVRIEPAQERAHQFLMVHLGLNGDEAGALRQFETLKTALADALDSEPAPSTLDILVAIKRGDFAPDRIAEARRAQRPQSMGGPPTILVRPVVTKGHNAASEHVADGLTLLTRTCLSRFRSWVVLPWPSHSFDIKDAIDFRHLKQQVGADFVLELTVDWRSQVAKLFASLIHCESGREDWAATFDITDHNLQDVTNSVAGRIASTLSIQIDHIIVRRFARSDGQNPAAYDAWIRGHQLARRWTVEDDMAAIALFERAIAIDAGLACAYTSLAAILSTAGIVRPGYAGADEDRRRAYTLSQEAILLDPSDARNHIGMAWSLMIAGTPGRALSHFRLAVELNPHDAETLIASSQGAAFAGLHDLAAEWAERALDLNPLHPPYYHGYLAVTHFLAGRYARCVEVAILAKGAFPNLSAWIAAAAACDGNIGLARASAAVFLAETLRRWEGPPSPTPEDVLAWLTNAIPLSDPSGRARLTTGLNIALASPKGNATYNVA